MRHFYNSITLSLTSFNIIFPNFPPTCYSFIFLETKQIKKYMHEIFRSFFLFLSQLFLPKIYFFIIYFLDCFYGYFMSYNNALTYVGIFAHVKAQQDFPIILLKDFFAQFFTACTHMNVFFVVHKKKLMQLCGFK